MDDSDSSGLSEPPSSPEPVKPTLTLKNGKLTAGNKKAASPPPSPSPPREPSPDREPEFYDDPDIAILVMFRSRFENAFPRDVPNLGPQDFERGLSSTEPSEQMENYLCALLGLALNRKKAVERGRHGRALEEAISTFKNQWPLSWQGINPLHGAKTFETMDGTERLSLLKSLVHWSLNSSEVISTIIKDSYKQSRHEDDLNQPLSVQPWGQDTKKRRYWLIEGRSDTAFRIYRESDRKAKQNKWRSIAATIEEAQNVARDLRVENGQGAHRLAARITAAIPQLEINEEKRKRKEYRQHRKAQFSRPPAGFSMYEGRTRGRRMNYNFDDQYEDDESEQDGFSRRRSARQSQNETQNEGPTVTASGRQVRSTFGRSYGSRLDQSDIPRSDDRDELASDDVDHTLHRGGRLKRSAHTAFDSHDRGRQHNDSENSVDELDDDEAASSGDQWDGDDEDVTGKFDEDEDEDEPMSDVDSADSLMDTTPKSLVVRLRYRKPLNDGEHTSGTELKQPNGQYSTSLPAEPRSQSVYDNTNHPNFSTPQVENGLKESPGQTSLHDSSAQVNGLPTPNTSTSYASSVQGPTPSSASSSILNITQPPSTASNPDPLIINHISKPQSEPLPTQPLTARYINGVANPQPPPDPQPDIKTQLPQPNSIESSNTLKYQEKPNDNNIPTHLIPAKTTLNHATVDDAPHFSDPARHQTFPQNTQLQNELHHEQV